MIKKNKVAIISNSCPPLGGAGIGSAHYNLFTTLIEKGYVVNIYTYADSLSDIAKTKKNQQIHRFGISKILQTAINLFVMLNYKFDRWILRKKRITGYAYQFPIVLNSILSSWKINKLLRKFNPDIVILPDMGAPGYSIKKIKNCVYIHISHHNPVRFINNPLIGLHDVEDAFKAISYEQASLKKIDAVLCPSNYMKKVFLNTFQFDGIVEVIPNIIDDRVINGIVKIDLRKIMNVEEDIPIVFVPSAGSEIKGSQYVIEILRRLHKQMYGEVAFYLNSRLTDKQLFELEHNNMSIKYFAPGQVDYMTNISYMKSCTLCVSPTLVESFGMALLEAMFCKLPCVSFDTGGNNEVIKSGETGFIVPYLDIEELMDKTHLLLSDEKLYALFQDNTMKLIKSTFSSQSIAEKYLSFFNSL